jgi:hypothetical protein
MQETRLWYRAVRRARGPLAGFCLLVAQVMLGDASGAEWSLRPLLDLRVGYSDNLLLAVDPVLSGAESALSAGTEGGYRTPRSEASLRLAGRSVRSPEAPTLDRDEQLGGLSWSRRGQRDRWGLGLGYSRLSTLTSELLDTGLVQAGGRRREWRVAPWWEHAMGPTQRVRLAASAVDTVFSGDSAGLSDFWSAAVSTGYAHDLDARRSAKLQLTHSVFSTRDESNRTVDMALSAGMTWRVTDLLNARGTVGWRRTRITQRLGPVRFSTTDQGLVLDAGVERRWQTSALSASLLRELAPSGAGNAVDRDRASLHYLRQLGPSLTGSAGLVAHRDADVTVAASRTGRRYLAVDGTLTWRLDRDWSLSVRAGYSRQRLGEPAELADATGLGLGLSYRPSGWRLSR